MNIFLASSFIKAYKRIIRKNPKLKTKIDVVIFVDIGKHEEVY